MGIVAKVRDELKALQELQAQLSTSSFDSLPALRHLLGGGDGGAALARLNELANETNGLGPAIQLILHRAVDDPSIDESLEAGLMSLAEDVTTENLDRVTPNLHVSMVHEELDIFVAYLGAQRLEFVEMGSIDISLSHSESEQSLADPTMQWRSHSEGTWIRASPLAPLRLNSTKRNLMTIEWSGELAPRFSIEWSGDFARHHKSSSSLGQTLTVALGTIATM